MVQHDLNAVTVDAQPATSAEDESRAGVYLLLSVLLRGAPGSGVLEQVRKLNAADGRDGFALAWEGLRLAAARVQAAELDDEYHELFIGVGRGELVPYGSWYLTGFLMEKPLGELRRDLQALGFEREPDVHEPEDHVAALCDVMAQLALDPQIPIERQGAFYQAHLAPWVERFCVDLAQSRAALFYKSVARLGSEFFALERRYLEMEG